MKLSETAKSLWAVEKAVELRAKYYLAQPVQNFGTKAGGQITLIVFAAMFVCVAIAAALQRHFTTD